MLFDFKSPKRAKERVNTQKKSILSLKFAKFEKKS